MLGLDVTDRRSAEQALIQSEKLAAVGRLASTIAHEINNPLEAVTHLLYLATTSGSFTSHQGLSGNSGMRVAPGFMPGARSSELRLPSAALSGI